MADSLFFGKSCEHRIFSELLKRGFDVYLPIVDDKGVDCIVRNGNGSHIDIQIKGRKPRWIFTLGKVEPRDNYFYIFMPPDQEIYVVPSSVIAKWLRGREKIGITAGMKAELEMNYKNNFDILSAYLSAH